MPLAPREAEARRDALFQLVDAEPLDWPFLANTGVPGAPFSACCVLLIAKHV
jgi:hypothetical protein